MVHFVLNLPLIYPSQRHISLNNDNATFTGWSHQIWWFTYVWTIPTQHWRWSPIFDPDVWQSYAKLSTKHITHLLFQNNIHKHGQDKWYMFPHVCLIFPDVFAHDMTNQSIHHPEKPSPRQTKSLSSNGSMKSDIREATSDPSTNEFRFFIGNLGWVL